MSSPPARDELPGSAEQAAALATRLAVDGHLVVRGVHDVGWLAGVQRMLEVLYLRQRALLQENPPDAELATVHSSGGVQLVHHPGADVQAFFAAAAKQILAPILPIAAEFLGTPLVVPVGYLTYRRHRIPNDPAADTTFVGFHQDANF